MARKVIVIPFLLAPMIGAWLLSLTSARVLGSYPRKVLFIAGIGLVIALFVDLTSLGIGGYPPGDALLLALHDVVLWTAIGAAVAWRMRPAAESHAAPWERDSIKVTGDSRWPNLR
jgi:hypothetical protein